MYTYVNTKGSVTNLFGSPCLPLYTDDMVIEYVGELVRPSVADVRERTLYNSMVGAGTYIFQLNWNDCVDATRSGNLAHLLNHSCEPNCYSRTIKGTC